MNYRPEHYETVAAGQTDQAIGGTGTPGDYIDTIVVTVTTSGATGIASLKDGASGASIPLVPASTPIGVYSIKVCLTAKKAGWFVTTGAAASAIVSGTFH